MSDVSKLPANTSDQNSVPDSRARGRRRFIQAGVTAAPVIMTVVSGPVLGQISCKSPSAFGSINTSLTGNPQTCNGVSPGYWKNHTDSWVGYTSGQLFNSVFSGGGYPGSTLLDVLGLNGGAPYDDLARHIVAALLNVSSGLNPSSIMTDALIKDMWNQYRTTGHWVHGNLDWGHDEIMAWLAQTFV